METIWLYVTSDKFMHLAIFWLVMLLIITMGDLLDMYNRGSVKHQRGKKSAASNAVPSSVPRP